MYAYSKKEKIKRYLRSACVVEYKEYSIASLFTLEQLKQFFKIDNIIQDDKLIIINSHNHITALLKEEGKYCYFNLSNKAEEIHTASIDEVAKLIFNANFYTESDSKPFKIISTTSAYIKPSPLGFRMYSFDKKHSVYPAQKDVLDAINPTLIPEKSYANECSGLMLAVIIDSQESAQYFIDKMDNSAALIDSVRNNQLELVKMFLKNSYVNNNSLSSEDVSAAFMMAVENNYFDIVKVFLENPYVDPNVKRYGKTALLVAVEKNHYDIAKLLIANAKVDPNVQVWDGGTALIKMCCRDNYHFNEYCVDIIEALLANQQTDCNLQDENGKTALIHAVRGGNARIVKSILTRKNLDINAADKDGNIALTMTVEYILNRTKNTGIILSYPNINPNAQNKNIGETALMIIAGDRLEEGCPEAIKNFLANKDLDINIKSEFGMTAVMCAASHGNIEAVKILITDKNIDLNIQDECGRTALMHAVVLNYLDIIRLFVADKNIDLNLKDRHGLTALMQASQAGRLDIVKILLTNKNIDLNAQDENGNTALTYAYIYGHISVIKVLKGVDYYDFAMWQKDFLNTSEEAGYIDEVKRILANKSFDPNVLDLDATLLMYAIDKRHLSIVKMLAITRGIDFNIQDRKGNTAFMRASCIGHLEIINVLLACDNIDLNIQNEEGETALIRVSRFGKFDVVKLFLSNQNIDLNVCDKSGNTALKLAANEGYVDIVRALLANTEINVNEQSGGWTALMLAAKCGRIGAVKALIGHPKIDLNLQGGDDGKYTYTALMFARKYIEIVKVLLAASNINPNIQSTASGWTMLMLASRCGNFDVVKLLLTNHLVDPNLSGKDGTTAIIAAAEGGYANIVKELLMSTSIDPNVQRTGCCLGGSALLIAIKLRYLDVIEVLLSNPKVDPNIQSIEDKQSCALLVAVEIWRLDIVNLLLANPKINPNLRNTCGYSALSTAIKKGYFDVIKVLLAHPDIDPKQHQRIDVH